MRGYSEEVWDVVKYDHNRGQTQFDIENDHNDPTHWYNGNNFNSELAIGEIKRDLPSDATTILEYIKKLSNDAIKDQDHYLVLGLDHLRYRATENQIKSAYRKACLLFHPDRHHSKYELPDSQFVHITKAYEVLSDPEKRQSYDSVDDEIDDTIPSIITDANNMKEFYKLFGRAFYRNARWSVEQPVPLIGNENTSYEHAQKFYIFWKNFRSKREFSHLDEQPVESGDCREERRYIARLNKKQREEHKKNEAKRIRQLIDNCRACDPRIARYTQVKAEKTRLEKEAKRKRQQLKKTSRNGFSVDNSQKTQLSQGSNLLHQQKDAPLSNKVNATTTDDKEKKIQERELKKKLKKQLDEQRHKLREFVERHSYFVKSSVDDGSNVKLKNIEQFDKFMKVVKLSDVEDLNRQFEQFNLDFDSCVTAYSSKLDMYYTSSGLISTDNGITKMTTSKSPTTQQQQPSVQTIQQDTWTKERVIILMKAMKTYPAGTKSRYEVVTEYINQHAKCNFNVKQIIQQAKTLTVNQDTNVIKMVVEQASESKITSHNNKQLNGSAKHVTMENNPSNSEWTAEEQKLFQQALKSIPIGTADRWIKISTLIPTKTAIQCQQRLKYLCEMIKKKKQEQCV